MLGQKLVFGFHGKTLPEEFKNLLREYKIGNVILADKELNIKAVIQKGTRIV